MDKIEFWKVIAACVIVFDIGFILGACWGNKENM